MKTLQISKDAVGAAVCVIAVLGMLAMHSTSGLSADQLLSGRLLAMHTVMELFSIIIAALIVVVSLHTLDDTGNGSTHVLACGFIVVFISDAMHTLTYQGMPSFITESSTPQAIFYWLAGRTVEVVTLGLIALGAYPRGMNRPAVIVLGLSVALLIVVLGSFHLDALPVLFVEGVGVTAFKAACELALCLANVAVAILLLRRARVTGDTRLKLLALSSFVMGVGALAFVSYKAPSDIQNILGHVYKVTAYVLLYAATFSASIKAPFHAMKAAETRALEARQRLASLGDNLPNTVLFHSEVDERSTTIRYTQISGSSRHVLGLEPEVVLGNPRALPDLVVDADRSRLIAARRRALQSMRPSEATGQIRRADGALRTCAFVWVPLREGETIILQGMLTDITEKLESEGARRVLEAQLQESQKMEALGTLSSGIAHDFNNILGAIVGNAALAEDAQKKVVARCDPMNLDAGAQQQFELSVTHVRRAAQRARGLVRQILTFSRRQPLNREVQPLQPIVKESLSMLQASLPARVQLEALLPNPTLRVRGDSTQIEQIVVNLCTNAWQAMGPAGGTVTVALQETVVAADVAAAQGIGAGRYAAIVVRDNGSGMTEETRRRLFEPFFTTKEPGRGTGLGMAVVHGIIRAHEGAILVSSEWGVGTTVQVLIPLVEDQADEVADAEEPTPATPDPLAARVLYIDDDEVMCLMVERLLQREGFEVVCEREATAALDRFRAQPHGFDIVVSDFNMPTHSGLDVLQEVQALRPGLPTILTSGGISPEVQKAAAAAGICQLLEKQFTFELLAKTITKALRQAREHRHETHGSRWPGSPH